MIPYLQVRPGTNGRKAVTAITFNAKKGPWFEFPKQYRDPKFHAEHKSLIENSKPKRFAHIKFTCWYGPTKRKYWDEKNGRFWFGEGTNQFYLEQKTLENREYSCK